jgi:hypothetical protein
MIRGVVSLVGRKVYRVGIARWRRLDLERQHRDAAPELQAGAAIPTEGSTMTEPVSERFYHRPRNIVAVLLALVAAVYNIGVMV